MTPERWKQIDEVFQKVVVQPLPERMTTLAAMCEGDEDLQSEVESLMGFHEQAQTFLEVPACEASAALICEHAFASMSGLKIGPYKIGPPLGAGGMGEVYLAENTNLEGKVAIKFLPPYLQSDELAKGRLIREAKAVARLDHPNICAVYDVKEEGDYSFIVMQYVAGETLAERIKKEPLEIRQALGITIQITAALAEAHSRGIVHRDIKPGNIMVTPRGEVKVLDFGLAKMIGSSRGERGANTLQPMLSHPGERPGTPPYMSPEQARGRAVDARGDLFAVGVILYECLAGQRPFVGATTEEILEQVKNYNPRPPSTFNPGVPPVLDALTLKSLAKNPATRHQSAEKFLDDLRVALAGLEKEDQLSTRPLESDRETSKFVSAFTTLSNVFARRRVFIASVALVLCLAAIISILAIVLTRMRPYHPTPAARQLYDHGTLALRNGAYLEASKALQQAVAAEDRFALAHARLAEAYAELDYGDKAKDEIIRAQALARDLRLPTSDSLYLQALANTVLRDFSPAVETYQQIAQQAADREKAIVYFDLGRAYEKNDQLDKARDSYRLAAGLAPQETAVYLRLGVVCGQSQDFACADEAFQKAEAGYQTLGNQEGVAEVLYQQAFVLVYQVKLPAARTHLEKALEISKTTGNQFQTIRALQLLSTVSELEGHITQAEQQATEAIELARSNGIETQATNGLIWLGNAFLVRGNYGDAEKYYQQALLLAQRDKMSVSEAWALTQLGSLRSLQHKTDEALQYVEKAVRFYQRGGYRKSLSLTLTLVGRAHRDKGDYEAALKSFEELHQLGEQLGDQSQVAFADLDIGNVLAYQEQYTEALRYFDDGHRIFTSLKAEVYQAHAAENLANVLWQLGQGDQAEKLLAEASSITAQGSQETLKQLLADIHLSQSRLKLSTGHAGDAQTESRKSIELAAGQYPSTALQAKATLALALARARRTAPETLCREALDAANDARDPQLLNAAWLSCAETMLEGGESQRALETALRAQADCARLGKADSEWRAWLIAAQASRKLGKEMTAGEYASHAVTRLSELEQRWGAEAYRDYLARPDITHFRTQLNQLLKPTKERKHHGTRRYSSHDSSSQDRRR